MLLGREKFMTKSKMLFPIFLIVVLFCVAVRSILIINNFDPMTNFYINSEDFNVKMLITVLWITSVLCLLIPFLDKIPEENRIRNNDKLLGLVTGIFSAIVMFTSFMGISTLIQTMPFDSSAQGRQNAFFMVIEIGVGLLLSFMLTSIAVIIYNKRTIVKRYIVTILFVVWTILRSLIFVRTVNTIATVPDNLFCILTILCSVLFLFGIGRLLFDVDYIKGYKIAVPFGFLTVLFGFLHSVPNYIVYFMNKHITFSPLSTDNLLSLGIAVYAVTILLIILFTKGEKEELFERNNNDKVLDQEISVCE